MEVEIEVTGGPLLEGSSKLPLKALVRKGEKKVVGLVRAEETVGTNWTWRPIVTHPDELSVVNGVNLKRRHLGGRLFEFEVTNTRLAPVTVEITFTGSGATDINPNPATAVVRPGSTDIVTTAELVGQLGMEWKWQ